jgi:hypothetical protein
MVLNAVKVGDISVKSMKNPRKMLLWGGAGQFLHTSSGQRKTG